MKALIEHLWYENREEVLSKSLAHCHTQHLHSVMLSDVPGKRIRLFYADGNHGLWRNDPKNLFYDKKPMSIGFHPHHCNITLHCVMGSIKNLKAKVVSPKRSAFFLSRYAYQSKIATGKSGFTFEADDYLQLISESDCWIHSGQPHTSAYLRSDELHTIVLHPGQSAAWMVYEGIENPDYNPSVWSNDRLSELDTSSLYQPMTESKIQEIINQIPNY